MRDDQPTTHENHTESKLRPRAVDAGYERAGATGVISGVVRGANASYSKTVRISDCSLSVRIVIYVVARWRQLN